MTNSTVAKQLFGSRQADWFRLAKRDHDLSIKRLSSLTGIPDTTLTTWATGETAMPAWALFELAEHIPDDLTCMLVERSGKYVGTCETGDGGFEKLGRETAAYTNELLQAHDPDSPGGVNVTPIEEALLKHRARKVACAGRAAAA